MNLKNVTAIVWDLDGTLLNSFEIFGEILADVVKDLGLAMPSRQERIIHYHGSLEESIQNVLGLSTPEEVIATTNLFLKYQENHYKGDLNAHLFTDAAVLAQQAAKQNIKQLLVTNRAHKNHGTASPRAIVAGTILAKCIHDIHAGDEVAFRKPDKRCVGDWLEIHKIQPENLLVIGDQHVDAQLAANLKARVVLVARDGNIPHLEKVEGDLSKLSVLDSLSDVLLN